MARLLIVEDDADTRELIARWLDRAGHAVETVNTGESALERIGTSTFHVVITDVNLPGLDGFDLARRRADHAIPFLFVSIVDQEDAPADIAVAGWLVKPFSRAQLLEAVADILLISPHA